jgi:hypothetical protein
LSAVVVVEVEEGGEEEEEEEEEVVMISLYGASEEGKTAGSLGLDAAQCRR